MSASLFHFDEVPNVIIFDKIDSTSKELSRMINNGYAEQGDVILASEQTDGHGRDGRKWESQLGNLFASFLLEPKISIAKLSFVSFLLAKNVIESLQDVVGDRAKISYKWPNDIMLNNKKMGGILLQTYLDPSSHDCNYMMCGLGLNLKHHPVHIDSADIFHEVQLMLDKNKLLYDVLQRFDAGYQEHLNSDRMSEIIKFLKNNTNLLGKEITVNSGNVQKSGVCSDIDSDGNLLLELRGTVERVLSGDIINIVA
ncbi:MAG: biotin--[acetyl-CoA-carboxylase] ligase [Rickettsiales bacterium]|jgi:BirA family transcriptional regulator, biotin operon repressor / biotin---[acetyl-CoA-carboxylase] ligase|nr:biotin--[acetyl-CoA-carboxylase] ligase [Rickettsiales bacterium]